MRFCIGSTLLLATFVGAWTAPAAAQMANPVVFDAGSTLENFRAKMRNNFDALRGFDGDLAELDPMVLPLTKSDWKFLSDRCDDCDEGQLIPVGVSKTPDLAIDFGTLDLESLTSGPVDFAGGRANLGNDGTVWWNLAIDSPDAAGIRLHLQDLNLPEGTEIYTFALSGEAQGPYTSEDISKSGSLWTLTVSDPLVFLEVRYPVAAEPPSFLLHEIGVMVDLFETPDPSTPTSKTTSCSDDFNQCHMEYACADHGDFPNLETISNAVARILFQKGAGYYLCSGGLLNDGRGLEQYLFMTANHCFDTQASAESVEFRWKYRSETCLAGCLPTSAGTLTTGGGDLIATSTSTDFTMIALDNAPPSGSVFLGWDAQTNYAATPGIALYRVHHPAGKMQHVTKYYTNTTNTSCTARPRSRYIQVTRDIGFTAGGSSGSLLVNGNAQVVGQFYGGCGAAAVGSCDPNRIHVDGQFRISYPLVEDELTEIPESGSTYTFNVANGDWDNPASWNPTRTAPELGDILEFDGTSASGPNITVTGIPNESIGRLFITGGANVILEDGRDTTTSISIISAGQSFAVDAGCSLELSNSSTGVVEIVLQPGALGTVSGDVVFAAQSANSNPRIVSRNTGGLEFLSGSTASVVPTSAITFDSISIPRGGFGGSSDGAVDGGVIFRAGSTWYQGGRPDGTRGGAQCAGPHGLNAPQQAAHFNHGSTYVVLRGTLDSPRKYPTVVFRDDTGVRDMHAGSIIDGDLIMAEPGGNAVGVGTLNLLGATEPALTISGSVVIPAGANTPELTSTATPGVVSRVNIGGDLTVGDPAKFPAGLNGRRWTFNGTALQTVNLGGAKTLHRLGVDNPTRVDFLNDISLTGSLELTNGILNSGTNTVLLGSTVVSTPIGGWIAGGVRRTLDPTNTASTRFFHVGTLDSPAFARVKPFSAGGSAGELEVRSFAGAHPDAAMIGTGLARWWRMIPEAGLDTVGATFTMSFDWQDTDLPSGADPNLLVLVHKLDGNTETFSGAALQLDITARTATTDGATTPEGDWFLAIPTMLNVESWMIQ